LLNKVEEVRRERAKSDRVERNQKLSHRIGFTPLNFHTVYPPNILDEPRSSLLTLF